MDTIEFKSFQKPVRLIETPYEKMRRRKLEQWAKAAERAKYAHRMPKIKRKAKKRVKLPSIKKLEKKLKDVMYPHVKERDGNTCISCGKKGLVGRDWQAGHYIKAELCNMEERYNPYNINSQCSTCNLWRRGNTIAYRKALINKYGLEVVEQIEERYNKPLPMNFNHREWLLEQIKIYK